MAGAGEFPVIPDEELRRIQGVALEWATYNGCPHPQSIRVVSTTFDAAIRVLHGPEVKSRDNDATYLVAIEGDIVLHQAVDRGAPRAPTGTWAALMIKPPQLSAGSLTLRTAEAAVDIGHLGRVYTLVG